MAKAATAKPQARLKLTGNATRKSTAPPATHIGWGEFRDKGSIRLTQIAETGKASCIGTGSANLQVRLCSAEKVPKRTKRILPEHKLQFDWVVNHLPQFRTLIGMNFPILIRLKNGSRVVADRHPNFEAGIVDTALAGIKARVYRDLLRAWVKDEPPSSPSCTGAKPPPRPPLLDKLIDALEEAEINPDDFVSKFKILIADRASRAALADYLRLTEEDLEGFCED